MRILFVENHAIFAQTIASTFLAGHRVLVVPSIAQAETALLQSSFEVALVDYDLDDGKGDVVVRRLRAMSFKGPIIAVSSHELGNEKLLAAGADALCPKLEFGRIVQVIESACSKVNPVAQSRISD